MYNNAPQYIHSLAPKPPPVVQGCVSISLTCVSYPEGLCSAKDTNLVIAKEGLNCAIGNSMPSVYSSSIYWLQSMAAAVGLWKCRSSLEVVFSQNSQNLLGIYPLYNTI